MTRHPDRPRHPDRLATSVLGTGLLANGLMAGLFAGFSYAVMPALARTDDRTFVITMQSVNRTIQNPVFGLILTGALVLPAAAAVLERRRGRRSAALWALLGTGGFAAALAVTSVVNVPLNDRLEGAGVPRDRTELAMVRADFEGLWTTANDLRSLACVAAVAALTKALADHAAGR